MARKANNPLEGKTQAEIDIVMSKRPSLMNEEEMRIYKRVKMDAWLIKNGKTPSVPKTPSAPKVRSAPKKAVSTLSPIQFVEDSKAKKEREKEESSSEESEEASFAVVPVSDGKIPRWIHIPELTDKLKEWTDSRTILVSFHGKIKICRLNWLEGEEMPTIRGGDVSDFHFAWPVAFVAVKHGFVRNYERDGIAKYNKSNAVMA